MSPPRGVAVLGAGGIGALLAALLERAGADVTCIARGATIAAIQDRGIEVRSPCFGDFSPRPAAVDRLDGDCRLLIVATKAPQLATALDRVPVECLSNGLVVPMLNGLEHVSFLREHFGPRVAAATIGLVQAELAEPGVVEHRSPTPPQILISGEGVEDAHAVDTAAELLELAGCDVMRMQTAAEVLWGKLVRLNAVALATAAAGQALGALRGDATWRADIDEAIREAAAIARVEGIEADDELIIGQIDRLPEGLTTSLQRDVDRGDLGELDSIAGAIVRAGKRHGLETPVIERLSAAVRERALGQR